MESSSQESGREVAKSISAFDPIQIADKILEFCQFTAELELYEYQREFAWRVIYSLIVNDGHELTALFSRQSGKTESIAVVIPGLMILLPILGGIFKELSAFKNGLWIGIFAPVYDQAQTTYDRTLLRLHSDNFQEVLKDPDIQTKIIGNGVRLDNGSFARMMSASRQSNIESKTYHLIICVSENTILNTLDGDVKIKDIKVGQKVKSLKDGHVYYDKVNKVFDQGVKDVFEIKTSDNKSLIATGNHKIFTNYGWMTVDDIRDQLDRRIIVCHTPTTQKEYYGAINFRYIIRRWLYRLWGYKEQQIISIKAKGKEHVWDIETKDTHAFFANGILVHNCEEAQDINRMKIQKCLTGDTLVPLPSGLYSTMKEVVEKKLSVITPFGPEIPLEFHDNGLQPVFEILLDNGRKIKVTKNHEHLVYSRGWKLIHKRKTFELNTKMRVAIPTELPFFGEYGNYKRGLVLGHFLGNGCMRVTPAFCGFQETWVTIIDAVLSEFYVKHSTGKINPGNGLIEGRFSRIEGLKNPLTEWFREIGIWGLKAPEKHIPNFAYSEECLIGIIQGLIETDGCVECPDKKPIISYASTSENMVRQLQNYLLKFGIHSRVFKRLNIKGFSGKSGVGYLWVLHIKDVISIRKFNDRIGLLRKQSLLDTAIKTIKNKKSRNESQFYPSSYRFQKIVSIKPIGKEHTYCVTVPNEEHLFIVDGVVTGNSIHPMLAATNGTIVKVGTPNGDRCEFFDAILRNRRRDTVVKDKRYRNHFQFDYSVCQKYNPKYAKYIKREKERFGEDGDFFKMAYRLVWMIETGVFITEDKFIACTQSNLDLTFSDSENIHVFGMDVGKSADSTVVTVLRLDMDDVDDQGFHKKILSSWLEIVGDDYETQFWKVWDFLSGYKLIRGCIDKTAVGDPIADRLYAQFEHQDVEIDAITFTSQSKHEMYKYLLQEMLSARLVIPYSRKVQRRREYKKFRQQMLDLEKKWRGQYMVVNHPDVRGAHDDYCLSEDTEILTFGGFKGIDELCEGDTIAAWDEGKIVYQAPSRVIKREYDGEMLHFDGEHFECLVTPEHKMIYERRTNIDSESCYVRAVTQASELLKIKTLKTSRRFPISGESNFKGVEMKDSTIKLLGWFITEGWVCHSKKKGWNDHRYMIGQSSVVNPEHVNEIDSLMNEHNIDYHRYVRKDGLIIWQIRKKSKEFFDNLMPTEVQRIPRYFLSEANLEQMKILFKTMMDGDGVWSRMTYSTIKKELAEDFQELCHKIGKGAIIKKSRSSCYNVYVLREGMRGVQKLIKTPYSGRIWCVTVPAGFIMIRYNNKISVVGNCDSLALACWAGSEVFQREIEILMDTPFRNEDANPIFSRRAERTIFNPGRRRGL